MPWLVYTDLDLNDNELLKVLLEKRSTDPSTPLDGRVWFRTDDGIIRFASAGQVRKLAEPVASDPVTALYGNGGTVEIGLDEVNLESRITSLMDGGGPDSYYVGQEVGSTVLDGGLALTTYYGGTADASSPSESAFTGGIADGGTA